MVKLKEYKNNLNELVNLLDKKGYIGIDASTRISLLEYRLLVKELEKANKYKLILKVPWLAKDKPKEVKGEVRPNKFILTTISKSRPKEVINSNWFNWNSFSSGLGVSSKKEWLATPIANQVYDLISFYSWNNYFSGRFRSRPKELINQLKD